MRDHLDLYVPSLVGVIAVLLGWIWLARLLRARGASRWRAVPLCLPLLVTAAGYGLFWFGFFSSATLAVQLHALRLAVAFWAGPFFQWIVAVWLALSALLLLPLRRAETD